MGLHESLEISYDEFAHHLKSLIDIQGLQQTSNILEILEKALRSVAFDRVNCDFMNFIDVADVLGIDPDYRDDVEERSSFVVVLRITENGFIYVLQELAHHRVEKVLESGVFISLQVDVYRLKEVERVIDYLILRGAEIVDA